MINQNLKTIDPEIAAIITSESNRQENCIELIASEKFTSKADREDKG